jgi:hypothetical protein
VLSPHPARAGSTAEFRLAESGRVTLEVFDAAGRAMRSHRTEWLPAGVHRWPVETGDQSGHGLYWVRLRAGTWTVSRRLVQVR